MKNNPLVKTLNPDVKALQAPQTPELTSTLSFNLPKRETLDDYLKAEAFMFKAPHYSEFGNNTRRQVLLAFVLVISGLVALILGLYFITKGY
jgi:hypothetical protein